MGTKDDLRISADHINIDSITTATIKAQYPRSELAMPEFTATTNCKNCGAPLDSNRNCVYCGTKHQMRSGIYVTATQIGFFAG